MPAGATARSRCFGHRALLRLAGDAVAVPVEVGAVTGLPAEQGYPAGGADGGAVGVGHLDGVSSRWWVDRVRCGYCAGGFGGQGLAGAAGEQVGGRGLLGGGGPEPVLGLDGDLAGDVGAADPGGRGQPGR